MSVQFKTKPTLLYTICTKSNGYDFKNPFKTELYVRLKNLFCL